MRMASKKPAVTQRADFHSDRSPVPTSAGAERIAATESKVVPNFSIPRKSATEVFQVAVAFFCRTSTRDSASGNGNALRRIAWMSAKTAATAPMPSARVSVTVKV
jgi:hypothetical protein